MQYDIKLVKLVSGETVMGNYNAIKKAIEGIVMLQAMPAAGGGVQLAMLPFGFPYEEEIGGEIGEIHFLYEIKKVPEELKTKYLEAKSSIKLTSGGSSSGLIL